MANEELVIERAQRRGFPADTVMTVHTIMDPTTAKGQDGAFQGTLGEVMGPFWRQKRRKIYDFRPECWEGTPLGTLRERSI